MPYDPNVGSDGQRHLYVYLEQRPGYFECKHCGNRGIDRSAFTDGITPTEDDIKWLHHGNLPPDDDAERS
jgi:hypothetical protein